MNIMWDKEYFPLASDLVNNWSISEIDLCKVVSNSNLINYGSEAIIDDLHNLGKIRVFSPPIYFRHFFLIFKILKISYFVSIPA